MTSNMGSSIIQEQLTELNSDNRSHKLEQINMEVMAALKKSIRPEFLNRIDEVVMFTPLQENEILDIIRIQFESLKKTLSKNQVQLEITEDAIHYIGKMSYDPQFGARPIKRFMQRNILNELSKLILAGNIEKEKPISIDYKEETLLFKNE